jgi:hypothetical protein
LYVPVGNPAPDYDNSVRQGDNLFTGSVVVLDAKTGAYKNHVQLVPRDWHDLDVSNPPALINTAGGKRLMAVSPKDGHLYGFDLADNKPLYRTPVTRIENVEEPFAVDKDLHFCPGAAGGEEWNQESAKKTIKNHGYHLSMLGGEIIERLNRDDEDNRKLPPRELILHYVDDEGGPLLSFFDPNVKAELAQHMAYDATCRKLLKFVKLEST